MQVKRVNQVNYSKSYTSADNANIPKVDFGHKWKSFIKGSRLQQSYANLKELKDFDVKNCSNWLSLADTSDGFLFKDLLKKIAKWANKMEAKMAQGTKEFENIAQSTAVEVYGKTDNNYDLENSVNILFEHWPYGKKLKNWYETKVRVKPTPFFYLD